MVEQRLSKLTHGELAVNGRNVGQFSLSEEEPQAIILEDETPEEARLKEQRSLIEKAV